MCLHKYRHFHRCKHIATWTIDCCFSFAQNVRLGEELKNTQNFRRAIECPDAESDHELLSEDVSGFCVRCSRNTWARCRVASSGSDQDKSVSEPEDLADADDFRVAAKMKPWEDGGSTVGDECSLSDAGDEGQDEGSEEDEKEDSDQGEDASHGEDSHGDTWDSGLTLSPSSLDLMAETPPASYPGDGKHHIDPYADSNFIRAKGRHEVVEADYGYSTDSEDYYTGEEHGPFQQYKHPPEFCPVDGSQPHWVWKIEEADEDQLGPLKGSLKRGEFAKRIGLGSESPGGCK